MRLAGAIVCRLERREVPGQTMKLQAVQQAAPTLSGGDSQHDVIMALIEAGLEGLVLGVALIWLAFGRGWLKVPGQITGLFFAGYGAARFFVEFFRQADPQFITDDNPWGHVIRLGEAGITMGQVLSLPMLLGGLFVIWLARRRA